MKGNKLGLGAYRTPQLPQGWAPACCFTPGPHLALPQTLGRAAQAGGVGQRHVHAPVTGRLSAGAGTWAPAWALPSLLCHPHSLSPPGWGLAPPPPPGSPAHPTGRRGPGSRGLGLTGFLGKDLQGSLGQREASRAPLCHLWTATGSPETRRSSGCHLC